MHFTVVLCCISIAVLKETLAVVTDRLYTIRTEGCSIAGFSEISEVIKKIVAAPPEIRNCSSVKPLVRTNASHVWVERQTLDSYNVLSEHTFYCCYKYFTAPKNLDNIVYSECKEFLTSVRVEHEFVHIECYHFDEVIYSDFFLFNYHEDIVPVMSPNKESFNILILGIESMSRLNFHRTMPLTSLFLKERGAVELLGYGKLGDNSFPNLFPLLTGLSFKYVKQNCMRNTVFNLDKCTNVFIWNKFKEKGYQTALGSDSIAGLLGNYEYHLSKLPTDYYLQPFIFETRKLFKNQSYQYHQCMSFRYYYNVLLKYIYGLTKHLKLNRLFGMFWEESISHENLNNPHVMDESYFKFLNNLAQDNYLSKTIVILLSDHGMRWGDIVRTEQGQLEGVLPLLGILFPEEFRRRYKLAFKNIQQNIHRLTTPYDIHETLIDLLNPAALEDNMIRMRTKSSVRSKSSLFLPISTMRNCTSVGIAEHWCPCHRGQKINVGSSVKTIVAHKLVELINKLLHDYPQCRKLNLSRIYDVYLVESNNQWRIYTVTLKTRPGGGIFDGTLIHSKSHWVVSGTVSRLNLYRNQSNCVTNDSVKMYCYCG